jgi:hypothetical protein
MRIIAFIEDWEVIKKILKHLGLWEVKARPPPKVKAPPPQRFTSMFLLDIQPPFSVYSTHSKATSYQPTINHGGGGSRQGLDRGLKSGKPARNSIRRDGNHG